MITWVDSVDIFIHEYVTQHATLLGARIMLFFTNLANADFIFVFLIALSAILYFMREKVIATLFMGGLGLGAGLSTLLKNSFLRDRPLEGAFTIAHHGYSFPSGHALIGMLFYGFIAHALFHSVRTRRAKILIIISAILLIFLIGVSRIYLGLHWLSDIVGGWLIGAIILGIFIWIFHFLHKKPAINFALLRGPTRSLVLLIVTALSCGLFYVFVTENAELRSTIDTVTIPEQ